jgi:hypothetical protein
MGAELEAGHGTANHMQDGCAPGTARVNKGKSDFALVKTGVNGSFHDISEQHLDRNCEEFSFHWDHWWVADSVRSRLSGLNERPLCHRKPIERQPTEAADRLLTN